MLITTPTLCPERGLSFTRLKFTPYTYTACIKTKIYKYIYIYTGILYFQTNQSINRSGEPAEMRRGRCGEEAAQGRAEHLQLRFPVLRSRRGQPLLAEVRVDEGSEAGVRVHEEDGDDA